MAVAMRWEVGPAWEQITMTRRLPAEFFPRETPGREKGFSLVEALIVVSIGLVLTALAIPMVRRAVQSYTLNSAATNMARMVELARYAAISQGGNVCTVFASNQFGLDANCDGLFANSDVRMVVPAGVSLGSSGPSTTGMSFPIPPEGVSCSDYSIKFNARGSKSIVCGTATASATTNIVFITGWGNTRAAVTVTGTGRTRSWSWNGSTWR